MSQHSIKRSILSYLSDLKSREVIRSNAEVIDRLVEALNRRGIKPRRNSNSPRPRDRFIHEDLKNLSVRPGSDLVIATKLCEAIADCLATMEFKGLSSNDRLTVFQQHFTESPVSPIDNYSGQHLFHRADEPKTRPRLYGDYVLFRTEARPMGGSPQDLETRVSRSLVRFYTPQRTGGLRFMLLPFSYTNDFLGAKGWVDDMGKSYLLTGQIIDRRAETIQGEKVFGGCSVLSVRSVTDARFVCYRSKKPGPIIEATPTVSFRALHGKMPSVSRGYLVRARGVKKRGGAARQTESQRYLEIKSLQSSLFQKHRVEETVEETAKMLQAITGYDSHFFYSYSKKSGSRGLLVNLPFRGPSRTDHDGNREHLTPEDVWPLALPNDTVPFWAASVEATRSREVKDKNFGFEL